MRKKLTGIYRFLPVQLVLLHLRKYQLLLLFWLILVATITGHFAETFGASSLFLAPEYLGEISFTSMLLLGSATAVFMMSWNITTFIIHSHRIPFLGAIRQCFVKYCLNNSLIPLAFLVFYSFISIRFQWKYEHTPIAKIIWLQLGFYLGLLIIIVFSFFYFFRVGRDLMKLVLTRITNPSVIREIVPYDTLDVEFDIIRAETYMSGFTSIEKISDLEPFSPRLLSTVLRRHHRNAITATIFAFLLLLLSGLFLEQPRLRIPAGGSFLILFSILMGVVGAVKYFLKTWELMGWVLIAVLLSILVKYKLFDLRSIAYGLNYKTATVPDYHYEGLKKIFTTQKWEADKKQGEARLNNWKALRTDSNTGAKPPLIVLCISGGGSRAAYWTFNTLQYLDSISKGMLFKNTVLISGASGGMIGAAYWNAIHTSCMEGKIKNPYDRKYQENIGKDLLNAIIFSFASVDLISPFNKIKLAGYSYTKDRGYAMEQELIRNTEGLLDRKIGDFKALETSGKIPAMIINGTIVNDGRRLMISSQPIGFLTQPLYALHDSLKPPIDAVDFAEFFKAQDPYNLRLTSALRMNATFPFVLPVVKLPSAPQMNVMDAGLRDNFGMEVCSRYLNVYAGWMKENAGEVLLIEIRDTRENEVFTPTQQSSLGNMMTDPFFVIQNKWQPFQSYQNAYLKDMLQMNMPEHFHSLSFQYIPQELNKTAALNFHITQREKSDIAQSIYQKRNQALANYFLQLLHQ